MGTGIVFYAVDDYLLDEIKNKIDENHDYYISNLEVNHTFIEDVYLSVDHLLRKCLNSNVSLLFSNLKFISPFPELVHKKEELDFEEQYKVFEESPYYEYATSDKVQYLKTKLQLISLEDVEVNYDCAELNKIEYTSIWCNYSDPNHAYNCLRLKEEILKLKEFFSTLPDDINLLYDVSR